MPWQPPAVDPQLALGDQGGSLESANSGGAWTPPPDPLPPPESGAGHDTILSSLTTAAGRILNFAGANAADKWGARPIGLDPETEATLRKSGFWNTYVDGHDSFLKSVNEAFVRPAATAADLAMRSFPAAAAGLGGLLTQTGAEIRGEGAAGAQAESGPAQRAVGGALGAAGEIAYGAGEGLLGPEFGEYAPAEEAALKGSQAQNLAAAASRVDEAAKARAVGVLGEGEAGFYGAAPATPENVEARTEAAKEAGVEPSPPEPAPPDIHALARRIDPDTFDQYDALALEREQHRATIARLGEERANSPEALEAQGQIDTILGKVRGVESRLTNAARDRLEAAQDRLDAALRDDTPQMRQARDGLLQADFAMRDLAPEVSAAYRQASDIAPHVPLVAEEATAAKPEPAGKAQEAPAEAAAAEAAPETSPETEAGIRAAPVAAAEAQTEAGPANVVGDEKLGAGTGATEGGTKAPTAKYGNLKAVEGTGETVTRSLSEGVEAKAIEDGLTETFGELPTYERLSMADQAAQVVKLMDTDYETAKAIAMGERQPPKGVLPESVFVGVEKRALAEGDVETLRQLATRSRLNTAATTMGQRIRSLGERDKASPVGLIQEVQDARERGLGRDAEAAKAETVAEIKAEVAKSASKADAWGAFLKTIECS